MDADHVEIVSKVETALSDVGIEVSKIVYSAYSDDGHEIFQSVSEGGQGLLLVDGYYWNDVTNHLNRWIPTPIPNIWDAPGTSGWGVAALIVGMIAAMAILLQMSSRRKRPIGP